MTTVLINAYACGPNRGSEPGMAWNWCCHLAKHCELHIITEGEFRDDIDRALPAMEHGHNMHFYYLPVSEKIRRMCWNQGDWRFYYYYAKWQKRALAEAHRIIASTHIDVMHQLNMVGFREPGFLYKIKDKPLIWGPIGGMEQTPVKYIETLPLKSKIKVLVKNCINDWQRKHDRRVKKMISTSSYVIAATKEALEIVQDYHHKIHSTHINETGCSAEIRAYSPLDNKDTFDIIWCGRFIYTKRLDLALYSLKNTKNADGIRLHIIGTGTDEDINAAKTLAQTLKIEQQVIWHGLVSNQEVQKLMQSADLFFFTSIKETTSTVILEAIQNGLPILCFDAFGFGPIVDSTVGIKIPLTNPTQSVKEFAEKIDYLYYHREKLRRMSEGCRAKQQELSWERKAEQMVEIYHKAIAQHEAK